MLDEPRNPFLLRYTGSKLNEENKQSLVNHLLTLSLCSKGLEVHLTQAIFLFPKVFCPSTVVKSGHLSSSHCADVPLD